MPQPFRPQLSPLPSLLSRRELLYRGGMGMGLVGLAGVLAQDGALANDGGPNENALAAKPAHFPAKAQQVVHLFMNGGPSQVDTFDYKPLLEKHHG